MTAPNTSPYQPPAVTGGQNASQGYRFAGQRPQTQSVGNAGAVPSPFGTPGTPQTLSSNASNPASAYATTVPTYGTAGASGNYLNQTIQPGALTDPVSIANQSWNTFAQSTEPQYQADLRSAAQIAGGAGQLGSGQFRSSLGNVANQRTQQLATAQQQLLQNAETQANANAYQNVGIAQQQQQFQAQQQQTAYAQALSNAQQQLAQTLGVGGLGVQQGQLALAQTANQQQYGLAQQQQALASALGYGSLGVQQQQANTAATSAANQYQLGLGSLANQQQQVANQANQFGQSLGLAQLENSQQYGLAQQQQALAQLQNSQQYGLQTAAQGIQQQQFGQSLAQQEQLAQLQNATQNRGLDLTQQQNQNAYLLQLLQSLGLSGYASPGTQSGTVSGVPSTSSSANNSSWNSAPLSAVMSEQQFVQGQILQSDPSLYAQMNPNATINYNGQQYTAQQWADYAKANPGVLSSNPSAAAGNASNAAFFAQNAKDAQANQQQFSQSLLQAQQDAQKNAQLQGAIQAFIQQYGPGIMKPGSPGYDVPNPEFTRDDGTMVSQAQRDQASENWSATHDGATGALLPPKSQGVDPATIASYQNLVNYYTQQGDDQEAAYWQNLLQQAA